MSIETDARRAALTIYSHANVRDRYDADLLMAGFADGALWAREQDTREPSDAEVEAAAEAMWDRWGGPGVFAHAPVHRQASFRRGARAALLAAQEVRRG